MIPHSRDSFAKFPQTHPQSHQEKNHRTLSLCLMELLTLCHVVSSSLGNTLIHIIEQDHPEKNYCDDFMVNKITFRSTFSIENLSSTSHQLELFIFPFHQVFF